MLRLVGTGRTRLLLLGLACAPTSGCVVGILDVGDGDHSGDHEATALVVRDIPVTSQEGIRLVGANGSVHIVGAADADKVTVRALKRVRSSSPEDAQAQLAELQVLTWTEAELVRVETRQPSHPDGRSYLVDYEVTVPEGFYVEGISGNGEVKVEGARNGLVLQVGNGNVTLRELTGCAWISLGNGNLDASASLPPGGQIVFSVGNGSAILTLQPEVSARLKAQVGNGTIVVSGLTVKDSVSNAHLFQGTLGSGEGLVDLTTGNGNIRVSGH